MQSWEGGREGGREGRGGGGERKEGRGGERRREEGREGGREEVEMIREMWERERGARNDDQCNLALAMKLRETSPG